MWWLGVVDGARELPISEIDFQWIQKCLEENCKVSEMQCLKFAADNLF